MADSIEQYYRDIDARRRAAQERLEAAIASGESRKVIEKLREAVITAGYTGD